MAPTPTVAMLSIATARNDERRTRHRPEQDARTGAPCHTRTFPPPGSSTSWHWPIVPVGFVKRHDDENGDDSRRTWVPCGERGIASVRVTMSCSQVTMCVILSAHDEVVRDDVGALNVRTSSIAPSHSPSPSPRHSPSSSRSIAPIRIRSSVPPVASHLVNAATSASVDLVGNRDWDAQVAVRDAAVYVSA